MDIETVDTPAKGEGKKWRLRKFTGVLLAALGFLWLAKQSGWMPMVHGHTAIFMPLVVTAVGLYMFFHDARANRRHRA